MASLARPCAEEPELNAHLLQAEGTEARPSRFGSVRIIGNSVLLETVASICAFCSSR